VSDAAPAIDPRHFRTVLGHVPTGVTVVSGLADGKPVGLTIGSFTSVSLDPPLVGFLPQLTSDSWVAMAPSGRFCVNVLGTDQQELCWSFAKSGNEAERFAGVPWHTAPSGAPIIDGVVAWIDCEVEVVHEMGDHVFVLGRVTALDVEAGGEPLVFCKGAVGHFEAD
jgi:flavin reductase (DIM6/NTAB) family NADH-FMN oxidoreductase RutF